MADADPCTIARVPRAPAQQRCALVPTRPSSLYLFSESEIMKKKSCTVADEEFDVDRLRLDTLSPPTPLARSVRSVPRHQQGQRFLKGPVPWAWLEAAARQPGKALHVGVVLWLLVGMKRSACVTLNLSRLGALGVSRYAASRGLKALRAAGLLRFEGRSGRVARVTVLDVSADTRVDRECDGG
jgi:hypothetical protein